MKNIQYKIPFFNRGKVKIRVPKEYVNLSYDYYTHPGHLAITWKEKHGRKKKNYYYAKMPSNFDQIPKISRQMPCCIQRHYSGGGLGYCLSFSEPDKSFMVNLEMGIFNQTNSFSPYIQVGLSKEWDDLELKLLGGVNHNLDGFYSFRAQYYLFPFRINVFNPYRKPEFSAVRYNDRYLRMYLGSEINLGKNNERLDFSEVNLHFGVAYVNYKYKSLVNKVFIHYGRGYDFTQNISSNTYPIAKFGVNFVLYRYN